MDMNGSRALAVTQQQAWDALNDPEVLKACIPGCDKVQPTGENQYAIGMSVKVGPVAAKFNGKINLEDVNPPSGYTLRFEGQGGPAGFGKGNAKVALTPTDTGCELSYTAQAQVGGKIAQVGQRLIDGVARSMAEDFFRRFDQEMQRRHPAAVVDAPAPAPHAVPAGESVPGAAGAGGSGFPLWAWAALAIAVAAAAYFAMR